MRKKGQRTSAAHSGFSLIAVLVVAVIGMALIGITFYIYESSIGTASLSMQRSQEYNVLQDALERGKSRLVELCNNMDPVPRWNKGLAAGTKITNPGSLIINDGVLTDSVKINGVTGQIQVEIFDAGYSEADVDTAALTGLDLMPPSLSITGSENDSIGAYLVRATLTLGKETKRLESTVFQRNLSETGTGDGGGGGTGQDGGGNVNPGD